MNVCLHKSAEAVKVDESTVKLYWLPKQDSHSKIVEHFHLNDNTALSRYMTPVEMKPVRGAVNIEDYDFVN